MYLKLPAIIIIVCIAIIVSGAINMIGEHLQISVPYRIIVSTLINLGIGVWLGVSHIPS